LIRFAIEKTGDGKKRRQVIVAAFSEVCNDVASYQFIEPVSERFKHLPMISGKTNRTF